MEKKHNKALVPVARMLRKNMTKEELHLWYDFLRTYPVKFLKQKILGKYVVDFYCAKAKLVIELDGSQHYEEENVRHDAERSAYLSEFGISVVRFDNAEINKNFYNVCEYIDRLVKQSLAERNSDFSVTRH